MMSIVMQSAFCAECHYAECRCGALAMTNPEKVVLERK
jgi:hypothetical protein